MMRARRGSWVVVTLLVGLTLAGRADAGKAKGGKADEARELLDKATAAFALSRYAVAAENYEKALELKPDPAVLYNAAQAHRLAGNKERALELYQSYLRMYGSEKRAEIEKHIENLKAAIDKDRAVATSPPTTPAPVGGTTIDAPPPAPAPPVKPEPAPPAVASAESAPPPASVPPPAPAPAETKPVLVSQPAAPSDDGSIVKKPWFWIIVGGVVAAGVVGGLLLGRKDPVDPTSSIMPVPGNGS
jgi:tetratricopeptide repeat protein